MNMTAATATNTATMQVKPVSAAIGSEVSGVDLSQPLSDAQFRRIEQAWHDGLILLFRGQHLDEAQQVAFCERFGTLAGVLNKHTGRGTHPSVMYISNIRENGQLIGALPDGEMFFHSDQCYVEQPAMATMLYAMEIPSKGGDTLFANMYKAYDTLPDELKKKLDGLTAENVYDYEASGTTRGSKIKEGVKHFAHPVIRTHPVTKRKALYVNRLMSDHIVGMPIGESNEILNFLFDHAEKPEFVYAHQWKVGDLILWDNRCSLHARSDFDASERRKLRRITVLGEKPF
jgi:taurine dioxygenase